MIVISNYSRDSKISDPKVAIRIKDKVFGFKITVDNFFFMQIFKTDDNIGNKKFGLNLWKSAFAPNMVPQVPSIKVIHD